MVSILTPLPLLVLIELLKCFIKKGIKIIPLNIAEYIIPLALAVWIMDDDGWAYNGIRIATNSFQLKEIKLLS